MTSRRVQRLNEQLKREISEIVRIRVRDPRVRGVTVTGVKASPDLTFARVWVNLPGQDDRREDALRGLEAASGFLRRCLGEELHIRRVPDLDFREDQTLERAFRVEQLLEEIGPLPEDEGGSPPDERSEPLDP